jgi:hypothetical protein
MSEQPEIMVVKLPEPATNEMVQLIANQMDQLFNQLRQMFDFTTGDVMSACLCHIIEAGKIGREGDMEGLRQDILASVEIAIAHYGRPEKRKSN